jgi:hypothetical protein
MSTIKVCIDKELPTEMDQVASRVAIRVRPR